MTRLPRWLYLLLAWIFVGLAVAGAVLPVLPTTPFVLAAAWAASRGSTRLHAWLLSHRLFGPMLADWEGSGAVSRRAKRVAVSTMAASSVHVSLRSSSSRS